jgi:hypothetical protein
MNQLSDKEILSCLLLAIIAVPLMIYMIKERKNVKSDYYSLQDACGYNLLSHEERRLHALLTTVRGQNPIALGIQKICNEGTVYKFRKMILELQESGSDNPVLLKKIIGEDVFHEVMGVSV